MWGINIHLKSLEATLAYLKISFFCVFWQFWTTWKQSEFLISENKNLMLAILYSSDLIQIDRIMSIELSTRIKQGIYRMYFIVNNVIFTLHLFLRYEYILQPLFQFLLIHLLPLNNALHIWSGKLKLHVFLWTKKK